MDKYQIQGGIPLKGSIRISGAKNAVLPILAACLLVEGKVILNDVPCLKDVRVMKELLEFLGCTVEWDSSTMAVDGSNVGAKTISDELMRKMRASNLVIGPLLARFGKVKVSYPGGCAIGSRPMDLHLKGLKDLGANIIEQHGYIEADCGSGLIGKEICLDFPSVGATENLLMAASLTKGKTIISNAAREPEITDLAKFLNACGAQIKGAGSDVIEIIGVDRLQGCQHSIVADRVEAGTFLVAVAATGGNVKLENIGIKNMEAVVAKLREMGVTILEEEDGIRVIGDKSFNSIDIKTMPYPGFPTDMQAQFMPLMAIAKGTSVVTENIFENRFKQIDELRRMGAKAKIEGSVAIIYGLDNQSLSGATVKATDLRAGAALVIAGLIADGVTVVEEIEHIDRGYDHFEEKLRALGANIERIQSK